ncbi:MAG: MBG domain-containing protein [Gemmataceae bacterium]
MYTVVATFASADPNYANGSGTGTLTITAAAPVITVTGGTFNYDGAAHAASAVALGAGSAPVAGSFFLTYNGAPQVPTAAGVYAVVGTFTSADPNYSNGSGTGSLVIVAVAPSIAAPQILAQPTAQTVVAGSIVTFTASVSGNPASSVQWQVSRNGGKSFANISGARNATLTFSASRNDDGNLYRAVFTSSAGKVTTIAALLTVQTKARVKASSEAIVAAFVAEQQQKVLFEERLELAREVYEAVSVALAKRA